MRVLSTLGVIGLVVALAFGAASTGAWFTDTDKIGETAVTAGTIDLALGTDYWDFEVDEFLQPGTTVDDYVTVGYFKTTNNGNLDMKWRGYITVTDDPKWMRDDLVVRCTLNPTGHVGNYGPAGKVLFSGVPLTDLTAVDNTCFLMDDPECAFAPGSWCGYKIEVRMLETAGNALQGATLKSTVTFDSTQRNNTGWTQ